MKILSYLVLIVLVSGCDLSFMDKEYLIKDNKVYLKGWNEGSGSYERLIKEADGNSFVSVENDKNILIGHDKNHVYKESTIIENFDPNTFEYLGGYFYKDSDSVYFFGYYNDVNECELEGIDPSTITVFEQYPWAKDKENVIYGRTILKINDTKSMVVLSANWAKTSSQVIYQGKLKKDIDAKSFKLLEGKFARDKNHLYESGNVVPE